MCPDGATLSFFVKVQDHTRQYYIIHVGGKTSKGGISISHDVYLSTTIYIPIPGRKYSIDCIIGNDVPLNVWFHYTIVVAKQHTEARVSSYTLRSDSELI